MQLLLTGTYCSKNKGDATMQQVFASELQRHQPNAKVAIASPFPELDTEHYAPIPVLRSRRRNLPLATLHWLLLEILRAFGHHPRSYILDPEIDAMAKANVVVDLSGDMLTEDYGSLVGYSHFLPLLQAQALGRPVVVCAQSVGPFHRLKPLARRILSRASLITVRESFSIQLLETLNCEDIAPRQTADLAFLLQPAPSDRIDSLLAAEGIPAATRPRLGISVSALLANRTNRHLSNSSDDKLEVFAQALDQAVDQLDIELLIVPHVFGPRESGDDRKVGERLAQRMRHIPLQLHGEYRPEELKGVIARCDAFVGCRMHANIAALDSCVPVLAVGYSHKFRGIFTDLGLANWVLPVENLNADELTATIFRIFTEASDYRQHLAEVLPDMRKRATNNITEIIHLVGDEAAKCP